MLKSTIINKQIPVKSFSSFEHTMVSTKLSSGDCLYLIFIYRLDYTAAVTFFEDREWWRVHRTCRISSVIKNDFIMSGDIKPPGKRLE